MAELILLNNIPSLPTVKENTVWRERPSLLIIRLATIALLTVDAMGVWFGCLQSLYPNQIVLIRRLFLHFLCAMSVNKDDTDSLCSSIIATRIDQPWVTLIRCFKNLSHNSYKNLKNCLKISLCSKALSTFMVDTCAIKDFGYLTWIIELRKVQKPSRHVYIVIITMILGCVHPVM